MDRSKIWNVRRVEKVDGYGMEIKILSKSIAEMHPPGVLDSFLQFLHDPFGFFLAAALDLQIPEFAHDDEAVALGALEGGTPAELAHVPVLRDVVYLAQLDHLLVCFVHRLPAQEPAILGNVQIFLMWLFGGLRVLDDQVALLQVVQGLLDFVLLQVQ